jgi:hypothetical protein
MDDASLSKTKLPTSNILAATQPYFCFATLLVHPLERGDFWLTLIQNHPSWSFFISSRSFKFSLSFLLRYFGVVCFDFLSWYVFVLIFRPSTMFVLISHLSTMFILFIFADLFRFKFNADSLILVSSTLQIRMHVYSGHLNFIISM